MPRRVYEPNPRHKRGSFGQDPPRWFPSRDSLCPDDLDLDTVLQLLVEAVDGSDPAHPGGKALFAMHAGDFYKAYSTETREGLDGVLEEVWHGYPVRRELVPRQVPARVLRKFVHQGRLTKPEHKKLVGSAS